MCGGPVVEVLFSTALVFWYLPSLDFVMVYLVGPSATAQCQADMAVQLFAGLQPMVAG